MSTQAVIGDRFMGQRVSVHQDGHLYVARDVVREDLGKRRYFPEHAVIDDAGRLVWIPHEEGGQMEPLIEGYDESGCIDRKLGK